MTAVETTVAPAAVARPEKGGVLFVVKSWRFLRRYPVLPVVVLITLIVAAVFAPLLAPNEPLRQTLRARNAPGFWDSKWYQDNQIERRYFFGADHVGRDILSRIIYGARISLSVMGIALASGLVVGVTLGLVAGYFGRWPDEVILRIVDIWHALPFLLVALVVAVVDRRAESQPGVWGWVWTHASDRTIVMALLALLTWSNFVRNIRAEVLSLKEKEYVQYSRLAGASHTWIIWRHLLPGVFNTVIVIATLSTGGLILAEASLSFLGAGIPSPTPAWGLMIAEGRDYVAKQWWMVVFPGLAIFLVVMSLNFLGDWLRDRLDPRLRQLSQ
jgi:peptide/nickel transport system permease protein